MTTTVFAPERASSGTAAASTTSPSAAWLHPTILAVVSLSFALVPLTLGRIFFYWDNAQQHYALTDFLHQSLRAGSFPQWWADIGAGVPLIAEGQSAQFHPIRLALALLFPTSLAFMGEIAAYFAIAALGTYFFLRRFQLSREAALFGGLCQIFGSYSVVYVGNMALHRSFAFLPLAMFAAEGVARRSWKNGLLLSLVIAVQLLAGHPTFMIVTAVATTSYLVMRLIQQSWHSGDTIRAAAPRLGRVLFVWCCCLGLGVALAAVQVVPMLMHIEQSIRQGGLSFEYAVNSLTTRLEYLPHLLFPHFYGQGNWLAEPQPGSGFFNEVPHASVYVGVVTLLLALSACWFRARWRGPTIPLFISAVLALAFAAGPRTPLFPMLWSMPGLGGLRYPSRFLMWLVFCLACLGAIGIDRVRARGRRRTHGRAQYTPVIAFALLSVACAAALQLLRGRLLQMVPIASGPSAGIALSLAFIATAVLLVTLLIRVRRRRTQLLVVWAIVLLGAVDLVVFRLRSDYAPAVDAETALQPPASVDFLRRDTTSFRIMSLIPPVAGLNRNEDLKSFLQADITALWGIASADFYASLMLKRYDALHQGLQWELTHSADAAPRLASFLSALNVRYVVAPAGVNLSGWDNVFSSTESALWRNPKTLPRAFVVGNIVPERIEVDRARHNRATHDRLHGYYRMVKDWGTRIEDSQIVDNVLESDIDYATTAVIGPDQPALPPSAAPGGSVVTLPATSPNRMQLEVSAPAAAMLVLAHNYYPGWSARVNGAAVPLYRANFVSMAVPIPAGRSTVRFSFSTPGLRIGMLISVVAVLAWALVAFALGPRRRAQPAR